MPLGKERGIGFMNDNVNNPKHYTDHPSGIECIQITEHMGFCLGNAMKYIWRADKKGKTIEDLQKARWYIESEINNRIGYTTSDAHDSPSVRDLHGATVEAGKVYQNTGMGTWEER